MRVAIVGSRKYPDLDRVRREVETLPAGTVVVSGGAPGVDRVAAETARARGLEVIEIKPDWEKHGKSAGMLRNPLIVKDADLVWAFWDGVSKGTKNTIRHAQTKCKVVKLFISQKEPYMEGKSPDMVIFDEFLFNNPHDPNAKS